MNEDIQVLMANLNEVLAVADWRSPDQTTDSETDSLVCLANRLRQEDPTDMSHFAY